MLTLLVTRARISIWHFVWIAVSLSVLLSLFLSQLIHGRIVWEYPSAVPVATALERTGVLSQEKL